MTPAFPRNATMNPAGAVGFRTCGSATDNHQNLAGAFANENKNMGI